MPIPFDEMATYETLSQPPDFQIWQPTTGAPGGPFGQMALSVAANQAGGQFGVMPLGFTNQGNLQNNLREQMRSRAFVQSMQQAAMADLPMTEQMSAGMASLAGRQYAGPWQDQTRSAHSLFAQMAPYLPNSVLDTAAANQSAASLTRHIYNSSSFRRDPITGSGSLSAGSAAEQGIQLRNSYQDRETGGWDMNTRGFTSDQMGQLVGNLSRRGMIATQQGSDQDVVREAFGRIIDPVARSKYMTEQGVSSLSSLTPEKAAALRAGGMQFDTPAGPQSLIQAGDVSNIKQAVDKYKGALAAMREVFGDAGHPNAPMRELYNALETFTQGTSQQFDPHRLEMTVRNMANAAKQAGIGVDGVVQMLQAAGQQNQATGMNPAFSSQMVTGALNFRSAYSDLGYGSIPAWGAHSIDQQMMTHQKLTGAANASPLANQLAAMMRLHHNLGSDTFRAGSDASRWIKQIEGGTALDPALASMDESTFAAALKGSSKLSAQVIDQAIYAKSVNQEWLFKDSIGGNVQRSAQPLEFRNKVLGTQGGAFQQVATSLLRDQMGPKGGGMAGPAGEMLGGIMGDALLNLDPKHLGLASERNMYVVGATVESLKAKAAAGDKTAQAILDTYGRDLGSGLKVMAETSYATAEQNALDQGLMPTGQTLTNLLMLNNPRMGAAEGKRAVENKLLSHLQSNMAGMTKDDPLGRVLSWAMKSGADQKDNATFGKMLGAYIGAPDKAAVGEVLAAQIQGLSVLQNDLEEKQLKLAKKFAGSADTKAYESSSEYAEAQTAAKAVQDTHKAALATMKGGELDVAMVKKAEDELSKDGAFTFSNVTINLDGKPLVVGAKGDGTATVAPGGGVKGGAVNPARGAP